jgi:hypothetical protein
MLHSHSYFTAAQILHPYISAVFVAVFQAADPLVPTSVIATSVIATAVDEEKTRGWWRVRGASAGTHDASPAPRVVQKTARCPKNDDHWGLHNRRLLMII